MQVAYYFIVDTEANHLDDVSINSSTDERHGTCGTEGMSGDILGFKSHVWATEHDGGIDGLGDHCGSYIIPPSCWCHEAS